MLYENYIKNVKINKYYVNYSEKGELWYGKWFKTLKEAKIFYDKCENYAFLHDKCDKLLYYKRVSEDLLKELGMKYIKYAKH